MSMVSNPEEMQNLKDQIQKLSTWLWGSSVLAKDIDLWLENFQAIESDKEKYIALSLLSQFMFYDLREIRQAMKSIYKDKFILPLIIEHRKNTQSYKIKEYDDYINDIMEKTVFASVGNPSESSSLLLYFFRQRNGLAKNFFVHTHQLLTEDYKKSDLKYLIYIDDISGSGGQAVSILKGVLPKIKKKYPNIKILYFTIFATTIALKKLKDSNLFDMIDTVFELDETYKVFSKESRYFNKNMDSKDKDFMENICKNYYKTKWKLKSDDISRKDGILNKDECGYADGQLSLGFFYNIPNNSLPIFWADSDSWTPIFKRYSKLYKR